MVRYDWKKCAIGLVAVGTTPRWVVKKKLAEDFEIPKVPFRVLPP